MDISKLNQLFYEPGKLNSRKCNEKWLKNNNLYQDIIDSTKFLNNSASLTLRVRCITEGISEHPKCMVCNINPVIIWQNRIFKTVCSLKCARNNFDTIKKAVEKTDYKARNIKSKQTCIKKYGVEFVCQTENQKNKTKITLLEKYGVNNISQVTDIKNKKELSRKQNGPHNYNSKKIINDPRIIDLLDKNLTPVEVATQLGLAYSTVYNYLKRNNLFEKYKTGYQSKAEIRVGEFIESLGFKIETSRRDIIPNKREIDIFIPSEKIAIEFNGIYYHSKKDEKYHIGKTNDCNILGIHLIHIFEHHWQGKQSIVESIIKSKLGINNRIFARLTKIVELTPAKSIQFLDKTHIQGGIGASVHLGLEYDSKLIAVMTFGKSRFDKAYEWELIRYASELGLNVVGGAGKLLKYFERTRQPKSLLSYCDRSRGSGNLYKQLGFTFQNNTSPNFFYVKSNTLEVISRYQGQKHKLNKLLVNFDPEKTGEENMIDSGYYKLWDCGNSKWGKLY